MWVCSLKHLNTFSSCLSCPESVCPSPHRVLSLEVRDSLMGAESSSRGFTTQERKKERKKERRRKKESLINTRTKWSIQQGLYAICIQSSSWMRVRCRVYTSWWNLFPLSFFDGYCSTVQGLLDWFEVDLGFTELSFIQMFTHLGWTCFLCRVSFRKRNVFTHLDWTSSCFNFRTTFFVYSSWFNFRTTFFGFQSF